MTHPQDTIDALTTGRHYLIATDGSCKGNPGTGGWGCIIQLKDGDEVVRQRALAGQGEVMISTYSKMALTAAIEALGHLSEPLPALVMSDSEYVVAGMTGRLDKWKADHWRNSSGPVPNRELWEQLDQLSQGRQLVWEWVRGHSGHPLNELADHLASLGARGKFSNGERSVRRYRPEWFI